jgi:phosphatidylglycerol:prolipoprotein diacylglycerol transferase
MHPVILSMGPVTIYSFGLTLALAVVVCAFLAKRDAAAAGIAPETIFDFIFWVVVSGILGARIFFIILNLEMFLADPKEIFMIQNGGLAWQGGLILGTTAALGFVRKKKIPCALMADLAAPYLALGQSIGRIGCFLNGCCYGRPVGWGWYVPVHHARLYPTQLFDTVGLFVIFLVLKKFQNRSRPRGQVFALYLILASVERFLNEFFRGDHAVTYAGLSVFQIVSLIIFFSGLSLFYYASKRPTTF